MTTLFCDRNCRGIVTVALAMASQTLFKAEFLKIKQLIFLNHE